MGGKRADIFIFEQGYAASRQQAKRMIEDGMVIVDGRVMTKPSKLLEPCCMIEASKPKYVGRGGLKLERAIELFNVDVTGGIFMDCGASTGGFTDCLLQHGAAHVYAVDVGSAQLEQSLRNDERVTCIENINIRYMEKCGWMDTVDGVVADVSFISIKLILERLFTIINQRAKYIVLIKPQFEAGEKNLGKHGIVSDKKIHCMVLEDIACFIIKNGYNINAVAPSPIKGGDGNIEYLICFDKLADSVYNIDRKAIRSTVEEAFSASK